jgi:hypothetical protein
MLSAPLNRRWVSTPTGRAEGENRIADGITRDAAGYSQPLRRNARYNPRQISTITTSTSG